MRTMITMLLSVGALGEQLPTKLLEPKFGQVLASFDSNLPSGRWHWRLTNDPVMGGRSNSTFRVTAQKTADWNGTVAVVPQLQAPGFCTLATSDGFGITAKFPDVSAYTHLLLRVRSRTPSYSGFKFSFAANTLNPQFKSYKARFALDAERDDWQTVAIPFTSFSNDWSPYTGDCDSPPDPSGEHQCCSKETPSVCPSKHNLRSISQVAVWAEGVAADFHLEMERIGAGAADGSAYW